MDTSLRFLASRKTKRRWLSGCFLLGILFQPARSQAILEFLTPQRLPAGGRVEIRTPEGIDCSSQQSDRPFVNVGGGVRPDPLIGIEPEPLAGVSITIPFGIDQGNCNKLIEMEEASSRVRKAQELYELGVIDEDEFNAVARKSYESLLDPER